MMEFRLGSHHSLTEQSIDWDFPTDGDSLELERKMIDFMIISRGIGLAANQIGMVKRVFVMGSKNIIGFPDPFALFNPKIIEKSKNIILDKEGCLSYPGLYLTVKRPDWIVARYQNSMGLVVETKFEGYLSKSFQHELDHLDGICFVDRVSKMKLQLALRKLRKK